MRFFTKVPLDALAVTVGSEESTRPTDKKLARPVDKKPAGSADKDPGPPRTAATAEFKSFACFLNLRP